LIDGREELGDELIAAPTELREYAAEELGALSLDEAFDAAAEGALKGGPETRERFELVVKPRIERIVGFA